MTHSFFDKIKKTQRGFVVINNEFALFANDLLDIAQINLGKKSRDDLIFLIHDIRGVTVRSYPLDDLDSALLIIGDLRYDDNEIKLIKHLMYKAQIIPDENVINSILPRREKSNSIVISGDLFDELEELIQSEDARKLKLTDMSQIVTVATREFLLNYHNKKRFIIKSKIEEITLDYTIIGRYIFCNICSLYNCKHVELFFKDDSLKNDLKKHGIKPIRYPTHEISEKELFGHDFLNAENKEKPNR